MKGKDILLKAVCILLSATVLIGTAGCGKKTVKKKKKKVIEEIIVVGDSSSDSTPSEPDDNRSDRYDDDDEPNNSVSRVRREEYQDDTVARFVEKFTPEFTYENASWNGPDGYVIIYSDLCRYSKSIAEKLQRFFAANDGVTLAVKKDTEVAAQKKEILVGDTNRYTSSLSEKQFAVTLKNGKLVFEGGHFAMTEKAADWFMTIKRESGKAAVLSGEASDFKSTVGDGYQYVWGDEFDGSGIDYNKWDDQFSSLFMNGTQKLYMTKGAEAEGLGTATVADGRLKLRGKRYFNQLAKEYEFVSAEMSTRNTMNFLFGYAELRARLPMQKGAWPSWWTTTAYRPELFRKGYTYETKPFNIEVDIFEVFASETEVIPNFHKWWSSQGSFITPESKHSTYPDEKRTKYTYPFNENLRNEYHIYGFKWTPEQIEFSVDGQVYQIYDLINGFDGENEYNEFMEQPLQFIMDNFLVVSDVTEISVGGRLINPSDLPIEYDIDYLRLYQKDGSGLWTKMEN